MEAMKLDVLKIIGGALLMVACILTVIFILCQESKENGMQALGGQSDSYFSRNKGKTLEAKAATATKILVAILFVFSIALNLIIRYVK